MSTPNELECPVCFECSVVIGRYIFNCSHEFCESCEHKLQARNIPCPLCRSSQISLTPSSTLPISVRRFDDNMIIIPLWQSRQIFSRLRHDSIIHIAWLLNINISFDTRSSYVYMHIPASYQTTEGLEHIKNSLILISGPDSEEY